MPTRTRFLIAPVGSVVLVLLTGQFIAAAAAADDKESAKKLPPASKKKVDFVRDLQEIFVKRCLECHGPETQESGFRIDRKADALAGGDLGRAIKPRDSAGSRLVRYIAGVDPDVVMPPEGEMLSKAEIGLVRAWIDQGAVWPDGVRLSAQETRSEHWAFQPIARPEVPQAVPPEWVNNSIDAFVLARLNERDIRPSTEADRYTLIRRLSLDLIGLPPTPQEADAFVGDSSPKAYENLVDWLLKSPHFGERWGRHWLDKARYADSDGYEKDRPRLNAWRWRDWVIEAVNNDMPFDQFTIEQFAGDLLPDATEMQKLATAFQRQTLTNTEGGTDKEQFRVEAIFDRVETTGTVWLGLTIGCARCHSHKFDPIAQREYYQLFAFMNNGDEVDTNVIISDEAVARYKTEKTKHDTAVGQLQRKLESVKSQLGPVLARWEQTSAGKLTRWIVVEPTSVKSNGGATFTKQKDGSYLVGGKNPQSDTYTIKLQTDLQGITGFRLEVLSDKSLPAGGPGRAEQGNFVLSELKVSAILVGGSKTKTVVLARATADYEQKDEKGKPKWPAAAAIDGKTETGWAIASEYGRRHVIAFETKDDVGFDDGPTELTVTLAQNYGKQHTIGRFRFWLTTDERLIRFDGVPENIAKILSVPAEQRDKKQRTALLDFYAGIDPATSKLVRELDELKVKALKSPTMSVRVIAERTTNPRKTHVFQRGDFLQPAVEVQPVTLELLHPLKARKTEEAADRLDLARWLMAPQNPLTARVAVNHIWSHLFGRPLVHTVNDFGTRGEKPTHPKLLDWLASRYIQIGWSRKQLIKTIVMSATYRQSSTHRPELAEIDPQNDLLSRQNRVRVEAEIVRDLSLAVSGLLSRKIGGPSVFPPMPADIAALSYANNFKWVTSQGEDRYRRGMYTFFKRTAPYPNLTTFDCPDANTTCVERQASNTPLQALVEASQSMAKRVLSQEFDNDSGRLTYAFRLCLARPLSSMERERFVELLETCRKWYKEHLDDAQKLIGNDVVQDVSADENAAWVATARVMMNTDGFITRE